MELDLRVRFREIVGEEVKTDLAGEKDDYAELHLIDDYPLTEGERLELKEALVQTLRLSTFFINWENKGNERSFAASVSHVKTNY